MSLMIISTIIKSTTLSSQPPITTAIGVDGEDFDVTRTNAAVMSTKPPPSAAPTTTPQMPGKPRTPPQIARDATVMIASAMVPKRSGRCNGTRGSSKLLVPPLSAFKDSLPVAHSTTAGRNPRTHYRAGYKVVSQRLTMSTSSLLVVVWRMGLRTYFAATQRNQGHAKRCKQGNNRGCCRHQGRDN